MEVPLYSCMFSFGLSAGDFTTTLQAGKGRTGLMICAYLVYTGMSADDALQLYAHRRTTNNEGVSYIRYKMTNMKCRVILMLYGSEYNVSGLII